MALLGGALLRVASSLFARAAAAPPQTRAAAAAAVSSHANERTSYGTALPPVIHATLVSSIDGSSTSSSNSNSAPTRPLHPDGRVVIVGDVHACAAELEALLREVKFKEGVDTLVLVGDLVGKGPSPREVIAIARRCGAHSVAGNHCHAAIAAADAWRAAPHSQPGAKQAWVAEVPPGAHDADVDYLRALPFTLALPEYGAVVVHAGFLPGTVRLVAGSGSGSNGAASIQIAPQGGDGVEPLFKMRDLVRGGGGGGGGGQAGGSGSNVAAWQWYEKSPPGVAARAWAKAWAGPVHVFFGHDAKRRLQTERAATGLDTGCVYGGSLTAAVLPAPRKVPAAVRAKVAAGEAPALSDYGAKLVSVPAEREWAPKDKEKGKGGGGEAGTAGGGGGDEAANSVGSGSKKDKSKGLAKKK